MLKVETSTPSSSDLTMQQRCGYSQNNCFVLSTAIVSIVNSQNEPVKYRCLLDSGTQLNIITKGLVERLRFPMASINCPIVGINQSITKISPNVKSIYVLGTANLKLK